jgi:hypothetical protein
MFHKAFKHLKSKIQFLADNQKLNDKQLAEYNEIQEGLLRAFTEEEKKCEYLLNQLQKVSADYNKLDKIMEDRVIKLEAICLMHGIIDINMYLNGAMTRSMLEEEVNRTRQLGGFIMPLAFRDKNIAKEFLNTWKNNYESD